MGKPCNQSELPPPRSQLHSQSCFTIDETAEDGKLPGAVEEMPLEVITMLEVIIKYAGHTLII